jgi:hypothetical protein
MSSINPVAVVAWKKLSTRSDLLVRALNGKLWFFKDNIPYVRAFAKTLLRAIREKPRIMIIQLPQGPLLLEAYLLKKLIGCKVVADIHTGFVISTDWKGKLLNAPFVKLLPTADIIVAHNKPQCALIPSKVKDKTIVVFDPWHLIEDQPLDYPPIQESYIVFPASFASDEPLEEVIDAINKFNLNIKMYITGNWKRKPQIQNCASEKVAFTGFLPNKAFGKLLANSTAIITGTKREYTSLMSGWEAVAYAKPLAVTKTRTLENVFGGYAKFYNWKNPESIAQALREITTTKLNWEEREKLKQRTITGLNELKYRIQTA